MLAKILDFLRYPSTWNGIIGFLSVAGVIITPDQANAIAVAGVALVSAVSMFFSDSDVKPRD